MAAMMKLSEMKDRIGCDTLSRKSGVYTARTEFFYTSGRTTADLVSAVKAAFPTATIIDSGEVWKPFRGAAPTANSSHWWVKFTV